MDASPAENTRVAPLHVILLQMEETRKREEAPKIINHSDFQNVINYIRAQYLLNNIIVVFRLTLLNISTLVTSVSENYFLFCYKIVDVSFFCYSLLNQVRKFLCPSKEKLLVFKTSILIIMIGILNIVLNYDESRLLNLYIFTK